MDLENPKHIKLLSLIINSPMTRDRLDMEQWVDNGGENRALQLLKTKEQFAFFLPDGMLEDPSFFKKAIKINPDVIKHVNQKKIRQIMFDVDLCCMIVKADLKWLEIIPDDIKNNKDKVVKVYAAVADVVSTDKEGITYENLPEIYRENPIIAEAFINSVWYGEFYGFDDLPEIIKKQVENGDIKVKDQDN